MTSKPAKTLDHVEVRKAAAALYEEIKLTGAYKPAVGPAKALQTAALALLRHEDRVKWHFVEARYVLPDYRTHAPEPHQVVPIRQGGIRRRT